MNYQLSGKSLAKRWRVSSNQALYHQGGTFYNNLKDFPGTLFDPEGYITFRTKEKYENCTYLSIGEKTNVPGCISNIPGYVKVV